MGNIATVGEERRRCFGIGGKPFALCVVTSPRGSVQPARWMREFRAFGVVSAGELGASARWVRGLGAVDTVDAGEPDAVGAVDEGVQCLQCLRCGRCGSSVQSVR